MLAADGTLAAPAYSGVQRVPPSIWVACPNHTCPAFGVQRQVWLKQVALGVVDLPRLACAACCWELPLPIFYEPVEELMPKNHVGRPPTNRDDIPAPAPVPVVAVPEPAAPAGPVTEPETPAETTAEETPDVAGTVPVEVPQTTPEVTQKPQARKKIPAKALRDA